MDIYYVDRRVTENGYHEVHQLGCLHMPDERDKRYLGSFPDCADAVREAERYYSKVNRCCYCTGKC